MVVALQNQLHQKRIREIEQEIEQSLCAKGTIENTLNEEKAQYDQLVQIVENLDEEMSAAEKQFEVFHY